MSNVVVSWDGSEATCPNEITVITNMNLGSFVNLVYNRMVALFGPNCANLNISSEGLKLTCGNDRAAFYKLVKALCKIPNADHIQEFTEFNLIIKDWGSNANQISEHRNVEIAPLRPVFDSVTAWNAEYRTNVTVYRLLASMYFLSDEYGRPGVTWNSPMLAMIGPSGVGKSSSIREMAATGLIDVVYVCCRQKESAGYPIQSAIYRLFISAIQNVKVSAQDNFDFKQFAPCFLALATAQYRVLCSENDQSLFLQLYMTLLDGSSKFDFVSEAESKICNEYSNLISLDYDQAVLEFVTAQHEYRQRVSKLIDAEYQRRCNLVHPTSDDKYWCYRYEQLECSKVQNRPLVFAFDEARELAKEKHSVLGYPVLRIIRAVLRQFPRALNYDGSTWKMIKFGSRRTANIYPRLCGLVTDTVSSIVTLAPPRHLDASYRFMEDFSAIHQFRPFHEFFTFDLLQSIPMQHETTLQELPLEELFTLGRPLWGASLRSCDVETKQALYDLVQFAKRKLSKTILVREPLSLGASMACLATRVAITFQGNAYLDSLLVSEHMAMCSYVALKHEWIQCHYPSEPILSEASAQLCMTEFPSRYKNMLSHYRQVSDESQVSRGDKGEEVAQLLMLLAHDLAVYNANETPSFFSKSCSVAKFLSCLAAINLKEAVESMGPELSNGKVSFTHFNRLNEWPDNKTLKQLWYRRAAAVMPAGSKGMDFLIPVAIEVNGRVLWTYILVQSKNYHKFTSTPSVTKVLARKMSREYLFHEDDPASPNTGFVRIYMYLGSHDPLCDVYTENARSYHSMTLRSRANTTGTPRNTAFGIYLRGLSPKIYPCLSFNGNQVDAIEIANLFQSILSSEHSHVRLEPWADKSVWLNDAKQLYPFLFKNVQSVRTDKDQVSAGSVRAYLETMSEDVDTNVSSGYSRGYKLVHADTDQSKFDDITKDTENLNMAGLTIDSANFDESKSGSNLGESSMTSANKNDDRKK